MACTLNPETIAKVVAFHGHSCPGLTIGLRAAEMALRELGEPSGDWVCITETDMCGVDAIQALTGCTFGKGNLVHRDYGKMAFTFFDRAAGKGFRLLLRPEARGGTDKEMGRLMGRIQDGLATPEEKARAAELREGLQRRLMSLDLGEMFSLSVVDAPPVRPARILQSLVCEECGERAMESRTRRFAGKTLCLPCFTEVEQKV
ncbi:formylmethanofuran dehydrogenase subunit E region [Alkalidesulfovibrio alkalitolerans DSM 16529]|uniref:Formylmethanofuran dehydrogenase subunit E region n=1 Tax=Alkalidesulfovibrio alkalitolerans DSM 16529 TaxID=1121439 RepID=S7T3G4_9BACT|nr:FmdE family protein [Alkalidesulfovibrio alkalitolerans]EPR31050.1 formylmethanofuran dehydrogenase subunit E region [Alkalidesulfovibrio alkalitolerans DSM 16529]